MVPCEYSFSFFFFEYVNHSLLQGKKNFEDIREEKEICGNYI